MMYLVTGKRFALLAVLASGLAACSSLGTTVAEDDPETVVPNTSLGRAMMEGLGAVPSRQSNINYTPRAPLVVPPNKTALVPPEDPNKLASSAAWPVDNDAKTNQILRDAAARDAARGPDENKVSPSELMAVRVPADAAPVREAELSMEERAKPVMPSKLGNMPRSGGSTLYDANGKPVRKALVEPPVAYLEPAAGVAVSTDDGTPEPVKKPFWKRLKFW